MTGHFGPHVSDGIAALRQDRARYQSGLINEQFRQAEENNIRRAQFMHGAATVAEVAAHFPAVFADHHYPQENPR